MGLAPVDELPLEVEPPPKLVEPGPVLPPPDELPVEDPAPVLLSPVDEPLVDPAPVLPPPVELSVEPPPVELLLLEPSLLDPSLDDSPPLVPELLVLPSDDPELDPSLELPAVVLASSLEEPESPVVVPEFVVPEVSPASPVEVVIAPPLVSSAPAVVSAPMVLPLEPLPDPSRPGVALAVALPAVESVVSPIGWPPDSPGLPTSSAQPAANKTKVRANGHVRVSD